MDSRIIELDRLNTEVIEILETEMGRQTCEVLNHSIAVLSIYSQDQLKLLQNAIPSPTSTLELQDSIPLAPKLKLEQQVI